jgi:hypothetical protein
MPDIRRGKPIDIEVCRTNVKVTTSKNKTKIWERKISNAPKVRKPSCGRWNPGKVNFSAFWWPFWKSQPNWKFRKFRKHPSCRNLFLCQIWLRTLRQCSC